MRDQELAKREKAQETDTPSCPAKSKARIAPTEKDKQLQQQQNQNTAVGTKSMLSDEEKKSFDDFMLEFF